MAGVYDPSQALSNLRREIFEGLKFTEGSYFDALAEYYAENEMHTEFLLLTILEKLTKEE